MSIGYEEALSTLESMFGQPWTRQTLDAVLRYHQGHMENTVDSILRHGEGSPETLITQLKSGTVPQDAAASIDEQLARQLQQESSVSQPPKPKPAGKKGRGTPTELPPDFLRVPGHKGTAGGVVDTDEALARMLQDELFSQELANNPEFAHLARGRPRTSGGLPVSSRTSGRIGELPSRAASGVRRAPGTDEGPNIVEKLTELGETAKRRLQPLTYIAFELGETAKRRLQLMAAQFQANNRFGKSKNTPPGFGGNNAEHRGLLDENEDDGQEMEMSFAMSGKKDE
eukprot:CAMPEP_0116573280 /NCGR_PEP_ID=MMETSP0397-20121206/18694_1 /TAXON_ID=216820 /ORGANISM="Cyclophora tenuis, Strain ECT3854" /LENGTH=284 /DNA_ID=CAMNT_0004101803 /DNA_START=5 /DNA_END=860 /DNA_ORIENTATION=-